MRRCLIFSTTYLPKMIGGAEVAIKEITDRIDPGSIEFHMITLRLDSTLPKKEKLGNVLVHRVGWSKKDPSHEELVRFPMYLIKVFYPVFAFLKAVKLHINYKYDFVWGNMSYASFPIVFLKLIFPRLPYILTLQEGDPIEIVVGRARIKVVYPIYKLVFLLADRVHAISTYLGNFARTMGSRRDPVVIPLGVNVGLFSGATDSNAVKEAEKRIKKEIQNTVLFTSSRLVVKNGIESVCRALALLPTTYIFIVAGDGPEEQTLRTLVEDLNIPDRVFFLGRMSHKEMLPYMRISDIFIRPSVSEGFGVSFLEGMAARLAVVATPVGGIPDFLRNEETGLFCRVNDPESIASAVRRLSEDEILRKRVIDNAFAMVQGDYDWNSIAQRMETLFNELINEKR